MATSDQPIASALPVAAPRKLPLWLIPSLFDLLFVSLPCWFFGMSDYGTGLLLYDGDTGWHIRTGGTGSSNTVSSLQATSSPSVNPANPGSPGNGFATSSSPACIPPSG